jgi:hypothetical protein
LAHLIACSLGLIWLAESTAGWFFLREKYCWLADFADNLKRTVVRMRKTHLINTTTVVRMRKATANHAHYLVV